MYEFTALTACLQWIKLSLMDNSITNEGQIWGGGPLVLQASVYAFYPDERIEYKMVDSRMFLWCLSGLGQVIINGKSFELFPEMWMYLPWRHAINYQADSRNPFRVACIHIVNHTRDEPSFSKIPHRPNEWPDISMLRSEPVVPGLGGLVHGYCSNDKEPLPLLALYIINKFQTHPLHPALFGLLARMLMDEMRESIVLHRAVEHPIPSHLHKILEFIRNHLDIPIQMETLCSISKCGPATIHRLFKTFIGESPMQWVAARKIQHAALLLLQSGLPIHHIATQVGFSDPFHFSRSFKRIMHKSPQAYRTERQTI